MKNLAVLCVFLVVYAAFAQSANSATFKSTHAQHDVALETNPQSTFWRNAEPAFLDFDISGKPVSGRHTQVRSRWTETNLYLLFICPYQELHLKPNPDTKAETNQLWKWDVAELFIGSDFKNIRRYKEFEVSPQGEWVDLDIDLDRPNNEHDWTWNSGFHVSARIDFKKKIWYGAMRIPFAAIDQRAARTGTIFRANLFRTEGTAPGAKLNTWQPPMSNTFHTPKRFGRLELIDRK